jgi:hypothetical protein
MVKTDLICEILGLLDQIVEEVSLGNEGAAPKVGRYHDAGGRLERLLGAEGTSSLKALARVLRHAAEVLEQ